MNSGLQAYNEQNKLAEWAQIVSQCRDSLKETEARDLLEIVESRYKRSSTIFCSRFDIPGWPESAN